MTKPEKNELAALSLKDEINANHRECLRAGNETIHHACEAGRLLAKVKTLVPHGTFEKWVDQYCDCKFRTAQGYMRLSADILALPKAQRAALLDTAESVASLKKLLKPTQNATPSPKTSPTSGKPKLAEIDESADEEEEFEDEPENDLDDTDDQPQEGPAFAPGDALGHMESIECQLRNLLDSGVLDDLCEMHPGPYADGVCEGLGSAMANVLLWKGQVA